MITFQEAQAIISQTQPQLATERTDYREALNRILAEDIFADTDMPPFDKSAMDGYACRQDDLATPLQLVGQIPAGVSTTHVLQTGECMRIMTGAPVPAGADCVIIHEHTEVMPDGRIRFLPTSTSRNICYKGEDIRQGERILNKGERLLSQHLAILAGTGATRPLVYKRPVAGILTSGDELVEPEEKPGTSGIRNSNAYQLEGQIRSMGAFAKYLGIVPDDPQISVEMISKALHECDILLITGGVSAGDYDFIPAALEQIGVQLHFHSLAVQPGRPTLFGTWNEKFVFGLPGNPVSSFVQFELLVKPLLFRMMGHIFRPLVPLLPMGTTIQRRKTKRLAFLPVKIDEDGMVRPVEYHGSAHIQAYVLADGLISLDIGQHEIKEGDLVRVRLI